MEASRTLINAQINFIDDTLRLIHIPRSCYGAHLQILLQLLFDDNREDGDSTNPEQLWSMRHPFFNISFNSVECSVLCSSHLAEKYFGHCAISTNNSSSTTSAPSVSKEDFVVISVEGEGLEAGQRVLDLTTPLAMASIPIFFITTYFCDFILVPLASRSQVVSALEDRGFIFESVPSATGPDSSHINVAAHHRNRSSISSSSLARTGSQASAASNPTTPPPASIAELQSRTFTMLSKRNIQLKALSEIRLTQCAGRREPSSHSHHHHLGGGGAAGPNAQDLSLQMGIVRCLARPPRFLSATLTATDPPAFLLEESTKREVFDCGPPGTEGEILLGGAAGQLVPIMLNLEPLPLEATGIVCGVAGRLAEATQSGLGAIEMSYLSTARTGTVLVEEEDLGAAMKALGLVEGG